MQTIKAFLDYDSAKRTGAEGDFQVVQLVNIDDLDVTNLIDLVLRFSSVDELEIYLVNKLGDEVRIKVEN